MENMMSANVPETLEEMKALGENEGFDLCFYDDFNSMERVWGWLRLEENLKYVYVVLKSGESCHNLLGLSLFESKEAAEASWREKLNEYKNENPIEKENEEGTDYVPDEEATEAETYEEASERFCLNLIPRAEFMDYLFWLPYDVVRVPTDEPCGRNETPKWTLKLDNEYGPIGKWELYDSFGELKLSGEGLDSLIEKSLRAEGRDEGWYMDLNPDDETRGICWFSKNPDGTKRYYDRDGNPIE
jgi:hypothetical protein